MTKKKRIKTQMSLTEILQAPGKDLLTFFHTLHPQSIAGDDFVYVPGEVRMPLLVAHVDTVHRVLPKTLLFDQTKRILSSPTGIGGDDRAGVYALLDLWTNLCPTPGLLLCDKEETGGIGAFNATYEIFDELLKYPFFIEIDRKGTGECVFYNHEHDEFIEYIESFGFKDGYGCFSDISILGAATKKCSVNLSAGYDKAHTLLETLSLDALEYTIRRARKIMLNMLNNPPAGLSFRLPKPPNKIDYTYGAFVGSTFHNDSLAWKGNDDLLNRDDFHWDAQGKYGKTCETCGSGAEVRYTNLSFGYLCDLCYQEWFGAGVVEATPKGGKISGL